MARTPLTVPLRGSMVQRLKTWTLELVSLGSSPQGRAKSSTCTPRQEEEGSSPQPSASLPTRPGLGFRPGEHSGLSLGCDSPAALSVRSPRASSLQRSPLQRLCGRPARPGERRPAAVSCRAQAGCQAESLKS